MSWVLLSVGAVSVAVVGFYLWGLWMMGQWGVLDECQECGASAVIESRGLRQCLTCEATWYPVTQ